MELIQGGDTATDVCNAVFTGTSIALGLAVTVYTAGAAAVAGWALTSWISAVGYVTCR